MLEQSIIDWRKAKTMIISILLTGWSICSGHSWISRGGGHGRIGNLGASGDLGTHSRTLRVIHWATVGIGRRVVGVEAGHLLQLGHFLVAEDFGELGGLLGRLAGEARWRRGHPHRHRRWCHRHWTDKGLDRGQ